ncbi:transcriptional regulator with XRE-family HTH domain [Parvibaculum sp. MBR-TMA-1.3b-4.2]
MRQNDALQFVHHKYYPRRTRLCPIAPIGTDTPDCESLYSYLLRLSWEHSVRPSCLAQFLYEYLAPEEMRDRMMRAKRNTILGTPSQALISAIEELTGLSQLSRLTLSSYKPFLPSKGQGNQPRKWCPLCLNEQRLLGAVYSKLAWEISTTPACIHHGVRLVSACSFCGGYIGHRSQYYTHSRLGFCRKCKSWLGGDGDAKGEEASIQEMAVARTIGDWIADGDEAHQWSLENLAHSLNVICNVGFGGRKIDLAEALGVGKSTISPWLNAKNSPTLPHLVNIANLANTSISALLKPDIHIKDMTAATISTREVIPIRSETKRRTQKSRTLRALEKYDEKNVPSTLKELARELDVDAKALKNAFPDEVQRIRGLIKSARAARLEKRSNAYRMFSEKMYRRTKSLTRREFFARVQREFGQIGWARSKDMWQRYKKLQHQ